MGSDADESNETKVERLLAAYAIAWAGDELLRRWTRSEDRDSLRDLAAWFNRELLRAAMERAGLSPVDEAVDRRYEALTGGGVSEGRRTQVASELDRAGVDVESLRSDFVSHQAVHTYLTEVRGAESPTGDVLGNDIETLQRLLGRTASVAESTLERNRDTDRVALGEFDVLVDVRVFCADCGADRDVVTLLSEGGCDCSPEQM